jgi:hypothetical protein
MEIPSTAVAGSGELKRRNHNRRPMLRAGPFVRLRADSFDRLRAGSSLRQERSVQDDRLCSEIHPLSLRNEVREALWKNSQ